MCRSTDCVSERDRRIGLVLVVPLGDQLVLLSFDDPVENPRSGDHDQDDVAATNGSIERCDPNSVAVSDDWEHRTTLGFDLDRLAARELCQRAHSLADLASACPITFAIVSRHLDGAGPVVLPVSR